MWKVGNLGSKKNNVPRATLGTTTHIDLAVGRFEKTRLEVRSSFPDNWWKKGCSRVIIT